MKITKPILYVDSGYSLVILARKIIKKYGKRSPYRGIIVMYPISEWKII